MRRYGEYSSRSRYSRRPDRGFRPQHSRPNPRVVERLPSPPMGLMLHTLTPASLDAVDCDYNNNDETSRITGWSPPLWSPPETPYRLREDSGDFYRDPNAARFPDHPLEPAVRALFLQNEAFDTHKIDVFACSSTMGNLLRFVRQVEKPFRCFVELIGNTLFIERHENSPRELIPNVRGYGHTFPEAYTSWNSDVKDSKSHQRLMMYDFAGLSCVVRFECDGYIDTTIPGRSRPTSFPVQADSRSNSLSVEVAGCHIPEDAVFDLKTRSIRRIGIDVLGEELPRYWVAQIPKFILAFHDTGLFEKIEVRDIRENVKEWERENQKTIRRFHWLLRKITSLLKASEKSSMELCCKSLDALELRTLASEDHRVLPAELTLRWARSDSGGGVRLPASKPVSSGSVIESDLAHYSDNEDESSPEGDVGSFSDSEEEYKIDYTACSDDCGYCGRCTY